MPSSIAWRRIAAPSLGESIKSARMEGDTSRRSCTRKNSGGGRNKRTVNTACATLATSSLGTPTSRSPLRGWDAQDSHRDAAARRFDRAQRWLDLAANVAGEVDVARTPTIRKQGGGGGPGAGGAVALGHGALSHKDDGLVEER